MSRNFGAGSRDMAKAGHFIARKSYKSYKSIADVSKRFADFVEFAKTQKIKKLEQITKETVHNYADSLKTRNLSAATALNYLSAVNRIMQEARGDNQVRVTGREAALEARQLVAKSYKGLADTSTANPRQLAIFELSRTLGLRFEEASKLDLFRAEKEAFQGKIKIIAGTKGGRARIVPATAAAKQAIKQAQEVAQNRYLIPENSSYRQHQLSMYKNFTNYHAGRHEYANSRYLELMTQAGIATQSPVLTTDREDGQLWRDYLAQKHQITPAEAREIDRSVRLQISQELGHNREEVLNSYIGGQK